MVPPTAAAALETSAFALKPDDTVDERGGALEGKGQREERDDKPLETQHEPGVPPRRYHGVKSRRVKLTF